MRDRISICYGLLDNSALNPGRPIPFSSDANGNIGVRLLFEGSVAINGVANNVDSVAVSATADNLKTANYLYAFNGISYDRLRSYDISTATQLPASKGALGVMGTQWGWDGGTNWQRVGIGSAANLAAQSPLLAQLSTQPGEWAVNHAPAANTTATITKAAGGAGVRHVCKGFSVSINAVAAIAAPLVVNLRDGATGAGAILWTDRLMAPAGTTFRLDRSGLNIIGSANTAMTLEFAAAPGATNFENVNMNGITTTG